MYNRGLIITASNRININMDEITRADLEDEYRRRKLNTQTMRRMFSRCRISAVSANNPTLEQFKRLLSSTFAGATENSFSYLYINCHGGPTRLWMVMGDQGSTQSVTYESLREMLDQIPGTKVIMIESCHSGASIQPDQAADGVCAPMAAPAADDPTALQQTVQRVFGPPHHAMMLRSGELRRPDYLVLAACRADQYSWEGVNGAYLTMEWAKAVGVDPFSDSFEPYGEMPADKNRDGYVTLPEIQAYSKAHPVYDWVTNRHLYDQNDVCYPENDTTPVFGPWAVYRGMFDDPPAPAQAYMNSALILTASAGLESAANEGERHKLEREYNRRAYNRRLATAMFSNCRIASRSYPDCDQRALENVILEYFEKATYNSYSYIYINCHGEENGLYMTRNGEKLAFVSFQQLRRILEKIPGTKVLLIEACHSGGAITPDGPAVRSMTARPDPAAFNRAVIQAFCQPQGPQVRRMGDFCQPEFRVLTACEMEQFAWGTADDKGNLFTRAWAKALGVDPETIRRSNNFPADRDRDGFVSLDDLMDYTPTEWIYDKIRQDDMCYPADNPTPVFGRDAIYGGLFARNGRSIQEYYECHRYEFGQPTGPVREMIHCTYRNFEKGVIVQYENGLVEGFHRTRYDLIRLYQAAFLEDNETNIPWVDEDLELYLKVTLYENDEERVYMERWPRPGANKVMTGGHDFEISKDGKPIDWRDPDQNLVHYDSGVLTGETQLKLHLEIWDYDGAGSGDDCLSVYDLRFNAENGWGLIKMPTSRCEDFVQSWDTALYRGVWSWTNKVRLNFMVSKTE